MNALIKRDAWSGSYGSGSYELSFTGFMLESVDANQPELFSLSEFKKNSRSGVWQFRALAAAMFISQQANATSGSNLGNLQIYCSVICASHNLNPSRARESILHQKTSIDSLLVEMPNESKAKSADKAELETIFNGLVKAWKSGTAGCSITTRRYAHGSYQAILVLGTDVVPFILRELRDRPDWWFEALKALTKADPTKPTDNFNDAVKAWLQWGIEQKIPY